MAEVCASCRNLSIKSLVPVKGCLCCEVVEHGRRLFETCLSSHSRCKSPKSTTLPPRVLDVGEAGEACDPYLYVPESSHESKYVALSYCWGEDTRAFVTTTNSNLPERRAGISLQSLPTALREAVYLTKRLGIRYLWIDALCIIQGDEADWTSNAARMDEIYGKATLTIAAASAASCNQGVLTLRLFQYWKLPSTFTPDDEPINHRAWTLQERLLSHRYLSVGTEYMTWQCPTQTQVRQPGFSEGESQSGKLNLRTYHLFSSLGDPFGLWKRVVIDYSSRYLTNEGDKLAALSGVAKVIHTHTGDQYLAGLWRKNIFQMLRWRVGINILKPIPYHRPTVYRAPSWSWASVDGNISLINVNDGVSRAEFINCDVEPLSLNDPFGKVKKGTLVLRRENGTYERVGIVYVDKEDWFKDAMVETVAII
ncbi:Heterokaryon incompatibility protein (HET) domain containing protein [Hyaloscypha variabilis]